MEYGASVDTVANTLRVHSTTVRGWIKNKENLRQWQNHHHNVLPAKRKQLKKPVNSLVDEATWLWFQERRSVGCPLSGSLVRMQALRFHASLGGAVDFGATDGWLNTYKVEFAKMMEEENLSPDQVFNADETGLNFREMPTKTLSAKSEPEAAGLKCQKERVTVMACSNAPASFKLPLVVIGKSAKPRAIKDLTNLPVCYKSQKSAWMMSTLFTDWFKEEFVPQVTGFLLKRDLPLKAVLLVDNCAAHPQQLSVGEIPVEFLPPNTTSLIQPMDQGCLQTLKLMYRQQLMGFILGRVNAGTTLTEALKKLTIREVVFWISDAWKRVLDKTIIKLWKPLYPEIQQRVEAASLSINEQNLRVVHNQNMKMWRSYFERSHFFQLLSQMDEYRGVDDAAIATWLQSPTTSDEILDENEVFQIVREELEDEVDVSIEELPQQKSNK
ncbi:tigger transposable element-derived protein 2-like [Diachasma alloeum]|uniref:tigger transposable element-derived protein 2-like n=1 Tax=Diachasma alloeum TaxID=454923 RepID=UPI0007383168|nr:tigger transposable element-derived protein 2-like [Diachasma alloeum]